MTIKEGNRFIYVCHPRTGTHFLRDWLMGAFKTEEVKGVPDYPMNYDTHLPISYIDKKAMNSHFKWGSIRNPFDFYVSWWAGFDYRQPFEAFMRETFSRKDIRRQYIDFGIMKKWDIGLCTWWYIRMFCDYKKLYELDSLDGIDLKEECLLDQVIHYESFQEEIELMFRNQLEPLTREQAIALNGKPLLPSKERQDWRLYYDNKLTKQVLHKDRLLFKAYPEYA